MVYRDVSSGESREISPYSTPSSSESISPFSGISKRKILTKPLLNCAICGGKTKCRHFGAVSCNACAAFFRRTIAEKRKYSCLQKENCILLSNLVRRMCRFCRFKKCVESGMQEDEVLSLGSSNNSGNSSTNTASPPSSNNSSTALMPLHNNDNNCNIININNNTNNYNSNYNNNNQYEIIKSSKQNKQRKPIIFKFSFSSLPGVSSDILRNLLYCYESVVPNRLAVSPTVTFDTERRSIMPDSYNFINNEAKVFWSYFNHSGLSNYVEEQTLHESLVDIIINWFTLQVLHNTVKFDGVSQNRLYFIDHRYLSITESGLTDWYSSDPEVARDTNCMVRMSAPLWQRIFDICKELKDIHFNNIEMACFYVLVLTNSMIHHSSNRIEMRKQITPFTNQIFRALSQYYNENYSGDETACKVGRIVMMLSLYNEAFHLLNEHRQQVMLCGKRIKYEELPYACKN